MKVDKNRYMIKLFRDLFIMDYEIDLIIKALIADGKLDGYPRGPLENEKEFKELLLRGALSYFEKHNPHVLILDKIKDSLGGE